MHDVSLVDFSLSMGCQTIDSSCMAGSLVLHPSIVGHAGRPKNPVCIRSRAGAEHCDSMETQSAEMHGGLTRKYLPTCLGAWLVEGCPDSSRPGAFLIRLVLAGTRVSVLAWNSTAPSQAFNMIR